MCASHKHKKKNGNGNFGSLIPFLTLLPTLFDATQVFDQKYPSSSFNSHNYYPSYGNFDLL